LKTFSILRKYFISFRISCIMKMTVN